MLFQDLPIAGPFAVSKFPTLASSISHGSSTPDTDKAPHAYPPPSPETLYTLSFLHLLLLRALRCRWRCWDRGGPRAFFIDDGIHCAEDAAVGCYIYHCFEVLLRSG